MSSGNQATPRKYLAGTSQVPDGSLMGSRYWTCDECGGEFDVDVTPSRHKRYAHPSVGLFRWRQRRWWGWLSRHLYTLGISSGGCHSGHGDGWIVRNHYRGRRPYVLGIKRERWGDPWHRIRYGHWPNRVVIGMCGTCCPWPCCGATGLDHAEGCDG